MKTDGLDLIIENADAVTLYFAAATNFVNYKDVSADQHQRVNDVLTKLGQRTYQEILESAVTDYQKYFTRVKLELPVTSNSFCLQLKE